MLLAAWITGIVWLCVAGCIYHDLHRNNQSFAFLKAISWPFIVVVRGTWALLSYIETHPETKPIQSKVEKPMMKAPTKECGCPAFKTCGCKLEAAINEMSKQFDKTILALKHKSSCCRNENGLCSCSVQTIINALAERAKAVVDAARELVP